MLLGAETEEGRRVGSARPGDGRAWKSWAQTTKRTAGFSFKQISCASYNQIWLKWHSAMAPGMGKTVKRAVFHIHAVYTSLHFAHVSSSAAPASGIIRETQTYVINRKTENRTQKGGFPVNQMFICLIFFCQGTRNLILHYTSWHGASG